MVKEEVEDIVNNIDYKNWSIHIGTHLDCERLYLQVRFTGKCPISGRSELQTGRKWDISKHMTKSEIVTTAFKAILTAEEHECREHFRYKGRAIFGPHFDVDSLAEISTTNNLDVREEA